MGEKTGIAWTHSTFNPWIGCSAVSPGCDHCYAKALVEGRMGRKFEQRWRTGEMNWKGPLKWNKIAEKTRARHLVFCASLADVFDNEVPSDWRADLWTLIRNTPALTWLILTKRIGNAGKMIALAQGTGVESLPVVLPNVWLGASVVNQVEADRDVPKLLATPAAKRFVSYEPALGPVNFRNLPIGKELAQLFPGTATRFDALHPMVPGRLDWIIVGGESTQGGKLARPFNMTWARTVVEQCRAAGVPPFVKQVGSLTYDGPEGNLRFLHTDRTGSNPDEWPAELRVQEFPS